MEEVLGIRSRKLRGMIRRNWSILVALLALVGVYWLWWEDRSFSAPFVYEVPQAGRWDFLERKSLYAWLHFFAILPVLALSFDKRVAYFRQWRYLFPGVILVGAFFIVWDVIFTAKGVWGFNEAYFLGFEILGLPFEEWLFFVTIPFASIFIYECLNYYFPKDWLAGAERGITITLMLLCATVGLIFLDRIYTSTTFLWTAVFLLGHLLLVKKGYRGRFYRAFLVVLVPFLLVDGVLTGALTQAPIVLYNPEEFLGLRIVSIPIEDAVYGFLMLMGAVTIMEYLRK